MQACSVFTKIKSIVLWTIGRDYVYLSLGVGWELHLPVSSPHFRWDWEVPVCWSPWQKRGKWCYKAPFICWKESIENIYNFADTYISWKATMPDCIKIQQNFISIYCVKTLVLLWILTSELANPFVGPGAPAPRMCPLLVWNWMLLCGMPVLCCCKVKIAVSNHI